MIGVDGQFVFQFDIGSEKDFIKLNDLEVFTTIEEAGNALPSFEITFQTHKEGILDEFCEGNSLKVSYGKDHSELKMAEFWISKVISGRIGADKYKIRALGLLNVPEYFTNKSLYMSAKKSAIEIMMEIAGKHFKVDTNKGSSEDKQYWIQPSTTDRQFMNELWLHSYLSNSFTIIGITQEGDFRIRDAKTLAAKSEDWTFSFKKESEKDIIYEADYTKVANSGFLNYLLGYGKEKLIHNLEAGDYTTEEVDALAPILSNASILNRSSSVQKRYAQQQQQSKDNVDKNYWKALLQNTINLAMYGSHTIELCATGQFKNIQVLDVGFFKDSSIEGYPNKAEQSMEYSSGKYIITKVSRSLSQQTLTTTVQMSRESFNSIKGSLR